jgi:adenylate cyclase
MTQARRLWRALGFPPVDDHDRAFTQSDVEILRGIRAAVDLQSVDFDDLIQLTRVIGQSLARVADAQVTASAERLRAESASGEALATRIQALAPGLEVFIAYVWRRHLLAALRHWSTSPSPSDRVVTVGFADLVGFTAMSRALAPRDLARMVDRFESIAYEHIPERGGRIVKMIGDEVMFAVDDGGFAADIAVGLVDACARDPDVPDVRIGLASGPTLAREGDLYGPTVNLASRLVTLARAGTVLLSEELGEHLRDDPRFELRHLRPVNLQGVGRVRCWVLRPGRV